jgi:hypothetical protein
LEERSSKEKPKTPRRARRQTRKKRMTKEKAR